MPGLISSTPIVSGCAETEPEIDRTEAQTRAEKMCFNTLLELGCTGGVVNRASGIGQPKALGLIGPLELAQREQWSLYSLRRGGECDAGHEETDDSLQLLTGQRSADSVYDASGRLNWHFIIPGVCVIDISGHQYNRQVLP